MTDTASDKRHHPFFIIDEIVVEKFELTPYEGWLYAVIVKYANHKDNIAFPSLTTLAKTAKMSERQVVRCLKVLETKRLIAIDRNKRPGKQESDVNHYRILDPHFQREGGDSESGRGDCQSGQVVTQSHSNQNDLNQTKDSTPSPNGEAVTPVASKKSKAKTEPKPRPRNPGYDMVAQDYYGYKIGSASFAALNGQIAQHASWVNGNSIDVKRRNEVTGKTETITVPPPSAPVTPALLANIHSRYEQENKLDYLPKDILKFVEIVESELAKSGKITRPPVAPDPNCPACGGVGYLVPDVPKGRSDYGTKIACDCTRREVKHELTA